MDERFTRTALMIGEDGVETLACSSVAVFGIGGVGSYTVEALARSGVGKLTLFDSDTVSESNINRQLIALTDTVGKYKVDVARERVLQINPKANVTAVRVFYSAENADEYDLTEFSYIVDAIDTVSSKLALIEKAKLTRVPIISCMGAGNKLDPTRFEVADISKTSVCPLARVMRCELRRRGIEHLKVVYSKEPAITPVNSVSGQKSVPGSISFVPSVAGLIIAGEVIKDIISSNK